MRSSVLPLVLLMMLSSCDKPSGEPNDAGAEQRGRLQMTALPASIGWLLSFSLPEQPGQPKAIYYRLENEPDFRPMSQGMMSIPHGKEPTKIYVKYEDSAGVMHGPIEFLHEPRSAMVTSHKHQLESLSAGWVYLRNMDGTKMIYWGSLLLYKCAIERIEYGINTMTPTLTREPGECNVEDPSILLDDPSEGYSVLPENATYVSVRLVYTDGTTSKLQKFDKFGN